ncbi:MAG TPA: DNA polymerase Y family protein [Kofleriaceae bacterium]|nr:DNA polymerase Y family protein [Kofleriaceae bacterium]
MRIACVYLPSFPLQVHVRRAPHLAGQPLAIAGGQEHPVVVACSRAAFEHGVRPGMTVLRARSLAPEVTLGTTDAEANLATIRAIAESLLALSSTVDVGIEGRDGASRAIFLHVPTGTRGDSFGGRIHALLARQGVRGRVGIADDRFSAWAAAATVRDSSAEAGLFAQTSTSVPRGGSAAFLAGLPLGLLPLDVDVLAMLRSLGILTLGDFAELPPPSMAQRWNDRGVDLRILASGDDPTALVAYAPTEAVTERLELARPLDSVEPLTFVLRPVFDRICDRLRGRGAGAERGVMRLVGASGTDVYPLDLGRPTLSGRELLDHARTVLARASLLEPVSAIEVVITREGEPEVGDLELFEQATGGNAASPMLGPAPEAHRRTLRGQRSVRDHRGQRTQRGKKDRRRPNLTLFD